MCQLLLERKKELEVREKMKCQTRTHRLTPLEIIDFVEAQEVLNTAIEVVVVVAPMVVLNIDCGIVVVACQPTT